MTPDFIAGFFASAALIVAIGAQNSMLLRQGIRREHVLPLVLVCAVSDALLIAAGVGGLGVLIESAPVALDIARYGGALFLLAYGAMAAKRAMRPKSLEFDVGLNVSRGKAIATCLVFTFFNPHVYLDTVVLLGALANQRPVSGRWVFGMGAAMASFVWFFVLGFGARLLAPVFTSSRAWQVLDSLIAMTMVSLSILLIV